MTVETHFTRVETVPAPYRSNNNSIVLKEDSSSSQRNSFSIIDLDFVILVSLSTNGIPALQYNGRPRRNQESTPNKAAAVEQSENAVSHRLQCCLGTSMARGPRPGRGLGTNARIWQNIQRCWGVYEVDTDPGVDGGRPRRCWYVCYADDMLSVQS